MWDGSAQKQALPLAQTAHSIVIATEFSGKI